MAARTDEPNLLERRAQALAEPSRRRVWDAVRAASRPVGVAELAGCQLRLHRVSQPLRRA